jgi:hypothetical protein
MNIVDPFLRILNGFAPFCSFASHQNLLSRPSGRLFFAEAVVAFDRA